MTTVCSRGAPPKRTPHPQPPPSDNPTTRQLITPSTAEVAAVELWRVGRPVQQTNRVLSSLGLKGGSQQSTYSHDVDVGGDHWYSHVT